MTWILAADDASHEELQELAAEQRALADERREQDRLAGILTELRQATLTMRHEQLSWPRRAWNALLVLIPC